MYKFWEKSFKNLWEKCRKELLEKSREEYLPGIAKNNLSGVSGEIPRQHLKNILRETSVKISR